MRLSCLRAKIKEIKMNEEMTKLGLSDAQQELIITSFYFIKSLFIDNCESRHREQYTAALLDALQTYTIEVIIDGK